MSEQVQEQQEKGFATMFKGGSSVAEEPKQEQVAEEQKEEVKQEGTEVDGGATEEVVEDAAPAAEEAQAEEPKAEEEEGVVTIDFGEEPKQKGEETQTLEAYKTQVKTLEEQIEKLKEQPKLDPRIEKLNQIISNGGDINQAVWEMQSKDYDTLDLKDTSNAMTVLKEKLKYIDGDDNELVGLYLEDKYPTLTGKKGEDDFDTDEEFNAQKKREELLLRKEAKTHLGQLKEFQDKMRLPEAPNHKQQEEYQKQIERYRAESTTKLNEIENFTVELGDELKLRFPFSGGGREFAKSVITEPENQAQFFVSRYATEDGKVNYNQFAEDMYFLSNRQRVFDSLFAQGKSAGKKEAVQELQGDNASISKNQKPPKKQLDQVSKGFAAMKFSR